MGHHLIRTNLLYYPFSPDTDLLTDVGMALVDVEADVELTRPS